MKRHFLVDFGLEVKKWKKVRFNSHPRFPFCKRVSHFESDLQILYPTFHGSLTVEYQEKYLQVL